MNNEQIKIIIETEEAKREEESIIRDAEKVRAGEEAEAAERAAELADGVALPLAPEDGPKAAADDDSASARPVDFDDDEDEPDDHGRGLV